MRTPESLQEQLCWDEETFESFIRSPWRVYQILGESGWGKTFFLFGLIGALRQRNISYVSKRLEEEERRFSCSDSISFCILDESQRLIKRDWNQLLRQLQQQPFRLVIASHKNHRPLLQQWGLHSETKQLAPPSPHFFKQWIQDSFRSAILPQKNFSLNSVPQFADDTLQPILEKANGNLHQARRFLYEILVKFNEQEDSAIRCWTWKE
ncbi:MAG: hypothetical protein AABZ60_12095, partial [Planctomycetota bacterium]